MTRRTPYVLAHVALLTLAGWALLQVVQLHSAPYVLGWLAGAVVLHDVLLLPLYSALDRAAAQALPGAVNYVRIPAGIWLLLGLVFLPDITGRGDAAFHHVSGLHLQGYLERWLLIGAALFIASGALYAAAGRGANRR